MALETSGYQSLTLKYDELKILREGFVFVAKETGNEKRSELKALFNRMLKRQPK
jgi:hypothetical protein